MSYVTVLSVLVDAVFELPFALAAPAATDAVTVPVCVIPLAATLYVVPLPLTAAVVAPAVPPRITPVFVNPVTAVLNTTVKLIGEPLVGSA